MCFSKISANSNPIDWLFKKFKDEYVATLALHDAADERDAALARNEFLEAQLQDTVMETDAYLDSLGNVTKHVHANDPQGDYFVQNIMSVEEMLTLLP